MEKSSEKGTRSERRKHSNEGSSGGGGRFKGVRMRKWGKWVAEVRLPNSRERIWLGSYDTPEKAARAYDAAIFCLRGANAKFNFPENPPEIPSAENLTPSQIQTAAARFAHENPIPVQEGSRDGGSSSTLPESRDDGDSSSTLPESRDVGDWPQLDPLLSDSMLDANSGWGDFGSSSFDVFPTEYYYPAEAEEEQEEQKEEDDFGSSGACCQSPRLWSF